LLTLFIIFICSFLAFSISAICGGGAGLILIPILRGLLPVNQVPAALSIGTFASSATRLFVFKKNISWTIVKYFVPAAIPAVWLGAYLLKFLSPIYLEIIMGLFLISNLPFVFKKQKELKEIKRPKNIQLIIIGFLAGFLSGITGAVGLLFNKFYLRYGLNKEEIIATRAANEIILHLIKIILYSLLGLITLKVLQVGMVVAISATTSTWTIKHILPRISEFVFKKIGYIAMVVSGFFMLSQSAGNLLAVNNGHLMTNSISTGLETKLKWQDADFALEFTYDEGFEFEQTISITELTQAQQEQVLAKKQNADKIIIETVYSIGDRSYEAYYFLNNKLVDKYDFK
jgi:uncharacterized membrane protein YfcA